MHTQSRAILGYQLNNMTNALTHGSGSKCTSLLYVSLYVPASLLYVSLYVPSHTAAAASALHSQAPNGSEFVASGMPVYL